MAWGTSPCLYANLVRAVATDDARCCGCCGEDAPVSGTDECPACRTFGNMHEIPPMGDPVLLAPPVDAFLAVPSFDELTVLDDPAEMFDATAGRAPPRVAFCDTVRLTR
jgi:hypothetical protein